MYNLEEIYGRANYRIYPKDGVSLSVPVGRCSSELNQFLTKTGATRFCLITAWNPGSRPLSREENIQAQQGLIRELQVYPGILPAFSDGDDWEGEEMLFVPDIEVPHAIEIAGKFGQAGILYGIRNGDVRVIMVDE